MSDFTELAKTARRISVEHGFAYRGDALRTANNPDGLQDYYSNRLFLVSGEVAEAHEELRKGHPMAHTYYREDGKPEGVPFELADVVIRAMDLAEECGLDLEALVVEKMKFNESRPHLHGKQF